MQEKFVIIFVVALAVVGALIYFGMNNKLNILPQKEMATAVIGGQTFNLEVVRAPEAMAQGLAGRDSVGDRDGMLFVFEKPGVEAFWMKGMKFAIDIVWVRGNKIVGLDKNAAPAVGNLPSGSGLPVYSSPDLVDKVIEVKSGTADELRLNTGNTVEITFSSI